MLYLIKKSFLFSLQLEAILLIDFMAIILGGFFANKMLIVSL